MNTLAQVAATAALTAVALIPAASAQAGPAITFTEHEQFTESFSDESFICQTELYTVTADLRVTTHLTALDSGMFRFTEIVNGRAVGVPLDGTGITYTATFHQFDLETIRAVGSGGVLAEVDSDVGSVVAHGSDGSLAHQRMHAHFTINANGEVSVEFFIDSLTC